MKFSINLASGNVGTIKQIRLVLVLVSIALVGMGIAEVMDGLAAQQQLAVETARAAELTQERRKVEERFQQEGLVLTKEGQAAVRARVEAANRMIGQRLFLWSNLLSDLERSIPSGVSLVSIQPQSSTATVTLKGEALTLARLTDYVIELEKSGAFHEVFLTDQKGQQDGTVSFTLHARY
jgi:Tfp pilus assembly protein PilN